jgi:hypothetical protein
MKSLVILGTSFLVDPPTLRDASCLMIWQRVNLYIWIQIFEGEDICPSQLLDLIFQSPTIFNIMAGCPLMKSTEKVRSMSPWQFFRHWRRCSSLNKIFLNQSRKQLCVRHWDCVEMRCPLTAILVIEMSWSLLSGLISWIDGRCDNSNMMLLVIASSGHPLGHQTNLLSLFLRKTTTKLSRATGRITFSG